MMASLFSGVSGLKNHQVKMNVIGNNIANINTIGFKTSRVNFQEALVQTLQGAGRPANVAPIPIARKTMPGARRAISASMASTSSALLRPVRHS